MTANAELPVNRVYQRLCRMVNDGTYAPGEKLPTERELGVTLGVSRLTVAKAMAHLVAETRIERFRGRGTFVTKPSPSQADRKTQDNATRRITFVTPGRQGIPSDIRHGVLEGFQSILGEAGCFVGVEFYRDADQYIQCLEHYSRPGTSGLAIWPDPDPRTKQLIEQMTAVHFPVVLVDTYLPDVDCDFVAGDNVQGAELMVSHLAQLGHSDIAYLTEPATRSSMLDRKTGFVRAMLDAGLAVHSDSLLLTATRQPEDVAKAIDRLYADSYRPTAIFCAHDDIAMAAYDALQERGIRVPEDVSLAGYDNFDKSEHFAVPLTTIRQDYPLMGQMAAQILLGRIDHGASVTYQSLVKPSLVVRKSTAAPGESQMTSSHVATLETKL